MYMTIEIERKFLVRGEPWHNVAGVEYRQGYLCTDKGRTVRIRTAGERGYLTIKGSTRGIVRAEYEYEIPLADARELLALCPHPPIEKTRYRIPHADLVWEVDVFHGENAGLVVAEIELEAEDQQVEVPPWVAQEVTGDRRYTNSNLSRNPYCRWLDSA
jgi:adenylate cyclase